MPFLTRKHFYDSNIQKQHHYSQEKVLQNLVELTEIT